MGPISLGSNMLRLKCVRWSAVKLSTVLRIFGMSRVTVGLWLALAPKVAGEKWFGSANQPDSTTALLRSVGGRDVGLGLGLAIDPRATSSLLAIGVVSDVVDAIAAMLVHDRMPRKNLRAAVSIAAIYAGIGTAIMWRTSATSARSSRSDHG